MPRPPISSVRSFTPSGTPARGTQVAADEAGPPTAAEQGGQDVRESRTEELFELAASCSDPSQRQAYHDDVVLLNSAVAEGIANRYRHRGIESEDLIQVAYLGLVKAVRGYRRGEGPGFLAYAVPTISGEIKRHFRDSGWMVRPPRRVQELRGAAAAKAGHLYQEQGRPPTPDEVATALGVPTGELGEAALAGGCYRALSLDAPCPWDGTMMLADSLAVEHDSIDHLVSVESLRPALRRLAERDRLILVLRYVNGWTQERIGREIGVSQMQVSRLLSRILATLRDELGGVVDPRDTSGDWSGSDPSGSRRPRAGTDSGLDAAS